MALDYMPKGLILDEADAMLNRDGRPGTYNKREHMLHLAFIFNLLSAAKKVQLNDGR